MIDHSLLHPTMSDADLEKGCRVALKYDVASVCIKPYAVRDAVQMLKGSDVKIGTVVGFPHGGNHTELKVLETECACRDGAAEIDMVINVGKVIGEDFDYASREISAVNQAAMKGGAILKVIFENDFLDDERIIRLCRICSDIGVAFVKTSTGYGFVKQPNGMYSYKGATVPHLKIMRRETDASVEVKAAGGVRTINDLMLVRSLGVTRIGATATANILDEAETRLAKGENLEELVPEDLAASGGY